MSRHKFPNLLFFVLKGILLVLLLWRGLAAPVSAEVVVIVNRDNPVSRLSRREVAAIYLFKKITWESGLEVIPINLRSRDPLRLELSKHWIRKSLAEIEQVYLMRALSGRGQPPVIVKSGEEIKAQVRRLKGAIGYIERDDLDDSVKALSFWDQD